MSYVYLTKHKIVGFEELCVFEVLLPVYPKIFEPFTSMQATPLNQTVTRRCNQCDVLTNLHVCSHCTSFEQKSEKENEKMSERKLETLQQPAKLTLLVLGS